MSLASKMNGWFALITLAFLVPSWLGYRLSAGSDVGMMLLLVALFGVPHGAIDHVIYNHTKAQPDRGWQLLRRFFVPYLGLLLAVAAGWLLWADGMFWIFLLTAAFHFGQSQLHTISLAERQPLKWLLYVVWGSLLLSHLWLTHWQSQVPVLSPVFSWNFSQDAALFKLVATVRIASAVLVPLLLCELLVLGLLLLTIQHCSLYTAFALYFGLWHSLRVIITEYHFLRASAGPAYSWQRFVQSFLPFSLLSFVGLALFFAAQQLFAFSISPFLLFLMFISALTAPHAIIMNGMYAWLPGQAASSKGPAPAAATPS
ncbi:MAG: Brp/Blh family beta-carotene 15,15'-dioxygenase [Chitinophagaceae bacterium]|nr:Brp/Blh family beta-carotene 15,15'-dioxygenase [Chitinophagaceae bacterium]